MGKRRLQTATAFSLIVCAAFVSLLLLARPVPASEDTAFELPFELSDNRIIVTAVVGKNKVARLLLDTGADQGLLTEEAARRFGLSTSGSREESGTGQNTVQWRDTEIQELRLGTTVFHNLPMGVISPEDFVNVFGTQTPDGVIGKPVFERYVVAIDYQQKMLRFTPPKAFVAPTDAVIISFQLPRQIPVIEAQLDGVTGNFGVDTGARSSLLVYGPFAEHNALREKYNARVEGVTGWGLGGPIRSLLARAHQVKIGSLDIREPVIRLSLQKSGMTTSTAMAGLIGPDILSQFVVTFDYSRRRILLVKNSDFDRRDSYDRAGLWMGWDGKQFTAIDVIAGGPADAAGIRIGDRLLAIDGVSTAQLVLPKVRERMRRSTPGTHVKMRIEHNSAQRDVDVCLRDLV
jgi:hypothetical protein